MKDDEKKKLGKTDEEDEDEDLEDDEDLDKDEDSDDEGEEEDESDADVDDDSDDEGDDEGSDDDEDDEEEEDSNKEPVSREKHRQAVAQKKHFREKARKYKEELDALKAKKKKPSPKKESENNDSLKERNDFRFDYPDLKTSVVDEIEAYARSKGISMRKAAKDPIVKILVRRARKKSENAKSSVDTGRRSGPTRRKVDYNSMSAQDMEKEAARRREAARDKA